MDILYIVGKGCSKCNNNELRYSLRSIEKYGKNIDRVFVCGYCPEWLSDEVVKLPYEINSDTKVIQKNWDIANKVIYAANNSDISDEFLVSMDDHFYTKQTNFNNYPYYVNKSVNKGFLPNAKRGHQYLDFLCDVMEVQKKHNIPTLYFSLHRNLHVSKKSLNERKEIIEKLRKENAPFEIFDFLNNYRFGKGEIVPTFVDDIKFYNGGEWWKTTIDECFSTGDFEENSGLDTLLKGLYSNKSKYEK